MVKSQKEVKSQKPKRTQKLENTIETLLLTTSVLYVKHLPWGIDEKGLKKYFDQFGKIQRYILPRSSTSGRIKGYAFIEYDSNEIAEIAAKTMNNFILFDRILKCEVISDRTKYNSIFKRWKRQFKFHDRYKAFVEKRNKVRTKEEITVSLKLAIEKEDKKREELKKMGIVYDFPGIRGLLK